MHRDLGGDAALAGLRQRLQDRGLKLMLDFVPNHMAPDHPWIDEHPEYFVQGSETDLARSPHNYCRVQTKNGPLVLAYGRDPYFDGWPDTLQLNYGNPELQQAMIGELERIAGQCDGVRCDMAMLVLPEVFERTWGIPDPALLAHGNAAGAGSGPGILFHGRGLLGSGMGRCSSRDSITPTTNGCTTASATGTPGRCASISAPILISRTIRPVSWKTTTNLGRLRPSRPRCTRPRQSSPSSPPGLRFFHQGQFQGRRKRISPHLVRAPEEPVDQRLEQFYGRLLAVLREAVVRDGRWQLLECSQAWDGNWTSDCFVASSWTGQDGEKCLVAVNYSDHQSQCYVAIPWPELAGQMWQLRDRMGTAIFDRERH